MDKPLYVLLVEDEQAECNAFANYIETVDEVKLVGVTNNADKALTLLKDCLPDAIILDLELHKGGGNGIVFLSELCKTSMPILPYILVTTNNISKVTHEQARKYGADFIIVKSQEDYSAKQVVDFLCSLKDIIHNSRSIKHVADEDDIVPPVEVKRRLTVRVTAEMNLIGISPKHLGCVYLIDAILHDMDGYLDYIAHVASEHGKTCASVERAMQNAINHAWTHGDTEDLLRYYTAIITSTSGNPTIKEFVKYYAYKIKNEYMAGDLQPSYKGK